MATEADEAPLGNVQRRGAADLGELGTGEKPERCIEYITVHELVHLLERKHNSRFAALMDGPMPDWKNAREELNRLPARQEEWEY